MTDHRVLIVDGDEAVLIAVERVLLRLGLRSVGTTSALRALALARTERFAVAVVEHELLDMGGTAFLVQLRELSPDTVRVVLTGSADLESVLSAINRGEVYRYLVKPWHDDLLRMELRQAVQHHVLCADNLRLTRLVKQMNRALRHQNRDLDRRVGASREEIQDLRGLLEASTDAAVAALSAIAAAHSDGLGLHGLRVARLCTALGPRLGLDVEELRDLEIAAQLHDVGKIGLSPQALNFPEEDLQPEELDLLHSHSERGEEVLRHLFGLRSAGTIVRHHHERWDGDGYPDGRAGEAIPFGARILTVCDALDERMHPLDGREPVTAEEALQAILESSPARFDAAVLRALVEHLDSPLAA